MNRLEDFKNTFDVVTPWAGEVPPGYSVDFQGTLTDVTFRRRWRGDASTIGGRYIQTSLPSLDNMTARRSFEIVDWLGEGWFEAVNWYVAAREARDRFVMVTLGAWHGSQAVGSYRALQCVNPMRCKLVAVEPLAENVELVRRHFRNNGIDPDHVWLIPMIISGTNNPVLFADGPRRMGAQNCISTNELVVREDYYKRLVRSEKAEQALENLLLRNRTGITIPGRDLGDGNMLEAEIKYVSAVTLNDVLGPFEIVDYLESDIQESEILVFPPFMDLIKRKVRRVHIGTHGKAVHWSLHELFARDGWEVVFNYEPETVHHTILGTFQTADGLLTFKNPILS
jgi:hypothetical protein